jgi:hypothetical protein
MTDKYGLFAQPAYLRAGGSATSDASTRRKDVDAAGPIDRDHGLNMKASIGKTGKVGAGWHDWIAGDDRGGDIHLHTVTAQNA